MILLYILVIVFAVVYITKRSSQSTSEDTNDTDGLSGTEFDLPPPDCKPHQWQSFDSVFGADIASIKKDIKDLGYEKYSKTFDDMTGRLICSKCGFVSGTAFALDQEKFKKTIVKLRGIYAEARKERPDLKD